MIKSVQHSDYQYIICNNDKAIYMHEFEENYNKILEKLQLNIDEYNFIIQKRKSKLSDIELIVIELTAEYMSIDREINFLEIYNQLAFLI